MTPENLNTVPAKETPSSNNFEAALQKLSSTPEGLSKLRPENVDVMEIKQSMAEAGLNLEIGEYERTALGEKQFRSLDSGRGVGVTAIMGRERAENMMAKIKDLSDGRAKIAGKEGTEGRGLRQFVADTFKLATMENPTEEDVAAYCTRINERVFKGYLKAKEYKNDPQAQETIRKAFEGVEDKSDIGEFASIAPFTVDEVWASVLYD